MLIGIRRETGAGDGSIGTRSGNGQGVHGREPLPQATVEASRVG